MMFGMTSSEIRKSFLEFFSAKGGSASGGEERGHKIIPSASLVPEGDATTLFTGSGMQPLIRYLLGEPHPLGKRLANSQKSLRAEDIDEVGDNRHIVFFEMLGNWSLGDYFKSEQLPWLFEFLTETIELDPQKLYVTVFSGAPEYGIPQDDESAGIWREIFNRKGIEAKTVAFGDPANGGELGMQGGRIFYYNAKKNWWSRTGPPDAMPAREPGGPDSEIFYDFGTPHDAKFGKECHPNCECGRFMEIGNSVFMEYKKTEDGKFEKLAQRNVDFGGGLERIAAASNNDPDIFNIDILKPLITKIRGAARNSNIRSERIVADHVRAAIFLIADGVAPSNKDRGYLLRRLIRRAVTHGHYLIGLPNGYLSETIDAVIDSYRKQYPELAEKHEEIKTVFNKEQAAFEKTYSGGIKEFEKVVAVAGQISGSDAFTLLATHGFPIELTEELAAQRGKTVEREAFEHEIEKHKEISRAGSEAKFGGHGLYLKTGEVTIRDKSEVEKVTRLHTATHLLHAALRAVLGPEVQQDGSDITVERTRFDFRFPRKMMPEELKKVEERVNGAIKKDLNVEWKEMSFEEATKEGALGFFREKYPPRVKVYTISDQKTGEAYSKELCGGPHVEHTGTIGTFKIVKEESASAGVRRVRAVIE
jgi:alanyl-tRNA synthetase